MTEQEAIKRLAPIVNNEAYTDSFSDACKMAIKALEKQIPKKPIALQHGDYRCPSCNRIIRMFEAINFCMFCGQAIDWRDEE